MENPEAPTRTPKKKRSTSMACDNCRRRKIRCNRERPCGRCVDVNLACAYTSIPRRKGPKGSSAHVLNFLRGLGTPPQHQNLFASAVAATTTTTTTTTNPASAPVLHSSNLENPGSSSPTPSLAFSQSSHSSTDHSILSLATSARGDVKRRISSTVLGAHVGLFLQHLYPIMPVIDSKLAADCSDPEALHPQRYAYIVALSAATHLQLNLDIGEYESAGDNLISGQDLINEAVRAVCEYDALEHPHIDTLLTMFFLFCAYGNLNKSDYAWHYLSQTISFLQILKLDREEVYVGFCPTEVEVRRRVFWLVFVTERAYALQTGRPVILRPTIRRPSVLNSEVPALLYGFVSLIAVFEQMVPEFYNWNINIACDSQECSTINSMYKSLSNPPALLDEVPETHQVDIIISQQWLRVSLWNYLAKRYPFHPRDLTTTKPLVPVQIPWIAGRIALACLSSASLPSVDAHGIGMEQKLYDIGESITQLVPHLSKASPSTANSTIPSSADIRDLLKSILNVLSRTRGCQSYLFSTLLKKSQDLLQASHIPAPLPTSTEQFDNIECSRSDVAAEEQQQQQQHTDAEAPEWAYLPEAELI
ncbi:hypothetical protein IFM60648_10496 [Aspergillus lentulus]|uniref:Zn(2)-C6 fungal-type domain-containing protein n=1 Tax=Aspergillus lentulus TaxID=293939 RepID=A0ABQ1B6N5_ASPLE|nr:hypothetical protein IFM60648_10496 [Aspergillus lentulus]